MAVTDVRLVVVVAAAAVNDANNQCQTVDRGRNEALLTFTVGLSATGVAPATHFWCNWQLDPTDRTQLATLLASIPQAATRVSIFTLSSQDPFVATPNPDSILRTLGLQRVETNGR